MNLSSALSQRHTFTMGYGTLSIQELDVQITNIDWFSSRDWKVKQRKGPLQFGYSLAFSEKEELGLILSYSAFRSEERRTPQPDPDRPPRDTEELLGWNKVRFFTFLPTYMHTWRREETFQIYSGISLGLVYRTSEKWEKDEPITQSDKFRYGFHVTGFGVRVGKKVGGFIELGFGYHGLLNGGLSVRL